MVAFILALLAIEIVALAFNSTIFFQLYWQRKKIIYFYFTILTAFAALWSVGTAIMLLSQRTGLVEFGYWLFLIAPALSTLYILYFCQQFIVGKVNHLYSLGVIGIVVFALVLAYNGTLLEIEFSNNGINSILPNKLFYLFYGLYFVIYFNISILTLRKHNERQDQAKYNQAKSILYGTGITGTLGVLTNIALPVFGVTKLVWLGPLFSLIFLSFSTLAITHYKLLDIRSAILRPTIYIFTIGILAGLYSTLITGVFGWTLFKAEVPIGQWIFLSAITAVLASLFAPLQRFFNRLSDKLFYRDAYDPQEFLDRLNKTIITNIELGILLRRAAAVIEEYMKSEYAVFGIYSNQDTTYRVVGTEAKAYTSSDLQAIADGFERLQARVVTAETLSSSEAIMHKILISNDISVAVRLSSVLDSDNHTTGYLFLGHKKSGNTYSKQDLRMIEIVADELVIAVQNSLRFEEIQQFNVTLQNRINQATTKVKKSNEKLQALDQTKDDFISMASHQLRTPLTSMKGYISMVLDEDVGPINENQRRMLQQAFISSQRMTYLISDLLNLSRLKTGKFVMDVAPVNLAHIVDQEVDQLRESAHSRDLLLEFEAPKEFPELELDETKIRQVIMNFLDNAIYYTPDGGKITVSLTEKAKNVEFTVTDTGIGVPKSQQHHLFTKFYRAPNAKQTRPDGTGLGLYMAKKVVVGQGGAVIFRSREGKGSTFGFTFPKRRSTGIEQPKDDE